MHVGIRRLLAAEAFEDFPPARQKAHSVERAYALLGASARTAPGVPPRGPLSAAYRRLVA